MSKQTFKWHDSFLFDDQVTDEERMIRDTARRFCQDKLMPRILEANRHEIFQREIMDEMGNMGFLGSTIPEEYGGAGMDLRWDDFGAAGHPFAETPNIDRLAGEGIRFTNFFAATPLCSPSRATFLTGQYAHTHGIVDNTARDSASHRLPTFALPLQQAGYRTGFFGKWHMGNDDSPRPGSPAGSR